MGISGTRGWRLAAALAVVVGGLGAGVVEVPPAGAQEPPPIAVEPATGLVDGQAVQVTVNTPGMFVTQCHADIGTAPDLATLFRFCGDQVVVDQPERPAEVTYRVRSSFTSFHGQRVDCGLGPQDCVIGVGETGGVNFVSTPIDVEPPPFAVYPTHTVDDQAVADVWVTGTPGDVTTVAQCASPVPATRADSRCGPATELTLGPDGRAGGTLTLVAALDADGGPVDCRATECAVARFAADGTTVASRVVTFRSPLVLTVTPDEGLGDHSVVNVAVTGTRDAYFEVYQCDASATDSGAIDGPCARLGRQFSSGSAPEQVDAAVRTSFTGNDGSTVTCGDAPTDCVVAVGGATSSQWATAALSFGHVSLDPATGLLDGGEVAVDASGLVPGGAYRVARCDDPGGGRAPTCEARDGAPEVVASPSGTLTATAMAAQRFTADDGRARYCRTDCSIALFDGDDRLRAWAPYALASGTLAAHPAIGLEDGERVTLTGDGLMPTYDGPPFWIFPTTGQWAVGQCDSVVMGEPTLLGVFRNCQVVAAADVPGSTLAAEVPVAATIESILGGETDCTAYAEACVLVLARIEQDGTVSLHAAPIALW